MGAGLEEWACVVEEEEMMGGGLEGRERSMDRMEMKTIEADHRLRMRQLVGFHGFGHGFAAPIPEQMLLGERFVDQGACSGSADRTEEYGDIPEAREAKQRSTVEGFDYTKPPLKEKPSTTIL